MVVIRHVQSDSKQPISVNLGMKLIKMNLGINFDLCFTCGYPHTNLFDSVHSYGCVQADLCLPKVIVSIKSVICQD